MVICSGKPCQAVTGIGSFKVDNMPTGEYPDLWLCVIQNVRRKLPEINDFRNDSLTTSSRILSYVPQSGH